MKRMSLKLLSLTVFAATFLGGSHQLFNTAFAAVGGAGPGGGGSYRNRTTGELKPIGEIEGIFNRTYELGSKTYAPYYDIPEEAQSELRKILAQVPYLPWRCDGDNKPCTLGKPRGTFIDHRNIDPLEYGKIKADYRKVIQSFGKVFDEAAFVLAAYSKGDQTYILKAFEDHTAERQAMLLIHEANMRGEYSESTTERLKKVLELDSAIWSFLRKGRSEESEWRLLNTLVRLGYRSPNELRTFKLDALSKKLGRPLLLSELITDPNVFAYTGRIASWSSEPFASFDPRIVQIFNAQSPGITEYLKPCTLTTVNRPVWDDYRPELDWDLYKMLQDPDYVIKNDFTRIRRESWMLHNGLSLDRIRSLNQMCSQNYERLLAARSKFNNDKFVVLTDFNGLALVSCGEADLPMAKQQVETGDTSPIVIMTSIQWLSMDCRSGQ